jgi:hypothetical protein
MLPGGGQWVTADAWIATVLASLISQTGDQSLIPPAQRALDRLVRLQDRTTGGWPTIRDETVDPAATAWAIGALHGARLARQLDVPPEVLATALTSLDRMQRADCHSIPPKSEDPTGDPTQDYFTSQALRQQPSDRTNLGLWNRKLRSRLIESQCTDGHARGSWRPSQHGTAEAGGRLYETVLNALALEVYFQHLPIWRSVPGTEPEPRDDVLQHKREELPP